MTDEQPLTKSELIDRMERARSALLETIDDVGDEELEARDEGSWAVTDHLAHLATWERGVAEFMKGRSRAVGMGLTEEAWGMTLDEVNDLIYRQNAALSASHARQMLDEAHEQMLAALENVGDEDLLRAYNSYLPEGEYPAAPERLLLETIVANTYEHYDDHLGYIREKLG
ncbi:MAG: ClbS/DfsB family four-helix bundle protein [Chloroflexota bacterium]